MADRLLLDTCAAIWITEDEYIDPEAVAAIDAAFEEESPVFVSPMTAWERGLLSARGRLASPVSPLVWFQRLIGEANLFLADLSPEILIESSFLPGSPPNDPADRIVISTARALDLMIVTRDRLILDYGQRGHVRVLKC